VPELTTTRNGSIDGQSSSVEGRKNMNELRVEFETAMSAEGCAQAFRNSVQKSYSGGRKPIGGLPPCAATVGTSSLLPSGGPDDLAQGSSLD
jgi:hypothetical protein